MLPDASESCALLNIQTLKKDLHLSLHFPSPDLGFFVEQYWFASWNLVQPLFYQEETLPPPCVNLVMNQRQSQIFGVMKGKFSYLLEKQGCAFGIKFKPGAFYPFVKVPITNFANTHRSCGDVLDVQGKALETVIGSATSAETIIPHVEQFIRERLPRRDDHITVIGEIVDQIRADRAITEVDNIVSRFNLSRRTLHRLFSTYVGVGPKWVIKYYRLRDAAAQLVTGAPPDWASFAQDLGYFDQAHFIKDFKATIGKTPTEFARMTV